MSQAKANHLEGARARLTTELSEETLAELQEAYLQGVAGDLKALDELLLEIKAAEQPWAESRVRLREVVHNIKGQGTSFGFPLMTEAGGSLHHLLSAIQTAPSAQALKVIEAHVVCLRQIIDRKITGDGGAQGAELIERLSTLTRKALG